MFRIKYVVSFLVFVIVAGCATGTRSLSTPDLGKTVQAAVDSTQRVLSIQASATEMIERANAQITATADALATQSSLLYQAQTAIAQSVTEEVGTLAVEETPLPGVTVASTITPAPNVTGTPVSLSEKKMRIACVDDEDKFRDECFNAMNELFPDPEVLVYKGCDHELSTDEWSLIIIDFSMNDSAPGPFCIKGFLLFQKTLVKAEEKAGLNPRQVPKVIGYSKTKSDEKAFIDAGANAFVLKDPNDPNRVEKLKEAADSLR